MPPFEGFPWGKIKATTIPDVFFATLLPEIDSLSELQVTLHLFWRISKVRRPPHCASGADLRADRTLVAGLARVSADPLLALEEGLGRAVERGTLLRLEVETRGQVDQLYFLHDSRGQEEIKQIRDGRLSLGVGRVSGRGVAWVPPERLDIYTLYERYIGLVTPVVARELEAAQSAFPSSWLEEAFRQAVSARKPYWRYVRAILERWATQGRGPAPIL